MATITQQQFDDVVANCDVYESRQLLSKLALQANASGLPEKQAQQYAEWVSVLQYLALPLLTTEDVTDLLRSRLLFGFKHPKIDVFSMIDQFLGSYVGPASDAPMRAFSKAIETNTEMLGSKPLSAWMTEHITHVGRGRKPKRESVGYIATDTNIQQLPERDRYILRKIFGLYNMLQPLPQSDDRLDLLDETDLWWGVDAPYEFKGLAVDEHGNLMTEEEFIAQQGAKRTGTAAPSAQVASQPTASVPSSLDIKKALDQQPQVGNIILTTTPFQDPAGEPVSATLRAWLQDYTQHAGFEYHTLQEREQYLFRSPNAKRLSTADKAKLRLLLQSFDEDIPLQFTKNFSVVEFPTQRSVRQAGSLSSGSSDIRSRL